jgi:hypothetical protein
MAQQSSDSVECSTVYENHNQTDYGPLKVLAVEGTSTVQVGTEEQPAIPGACFVLFTEEDHKPVTSVKASSDGRFQLKDVEPGRYRLIARADGFCTANIPLEVVRASDREKEEILVHFLPRGIDTCSYGELAAPRRDIPKSTPTTPR